MFLRFSNSAVAFALSPPRPFRPFGVVMSWRRSTTSQPNSSLWWSLLLPALPLLEAGWWRCLHICHNGLWSTHFIVVSSVPAVWCCFGCYFGAASDSDGFGFGRQRFLSLSWWLGWLLVADGSDRRCSDCCLTGAGTWVLPPFHCRCLHHQSPRGASD